MMSVAEEGGVAMRTRIAAMLDDIERDHRIRILLAVESGSRAWGFASSDSDWDVRFLYVRPLESYLRINPPPDVIEVPLTDELDLSGWDLRKALALLVASNAVALEWLASPVVYRRDDEACAVLTELTRAAAHLPALSYHYDRLACRHWVPTPGMPGPVQDAVLRPASRTCARLDAQLRPAAADGPGWFDGGLGVAVESAGRD